MQKELADALCGSVAFAAAVVLSSVSLSHTRFPKAGFDMGTPWGTAAHVSSPATIMASYS